MSTDRTHDAKLLREFDRAMLRSAFASLFWAVIEERKKEGLTLKQLSAALSKDKSQISRWFSAEAPNWQVDTIADLASALEIDVRVEGVDLRSGRVFTPSGPRQVSAADDRSRTSSSDFSSRVAKAPQGMQVRALG